MNDIIEIVEGNLRALLESGELECPAGDCDNQRFRVNIRRDDEKGFVGDASCRDCELRIELDLDGPINEGETTLTGFRDQFST